MATIEFRHVTKTYTDKVGGHKKVLSGVSFIVADSEFCCVLGPSGCGKSTTLNLIAGLLQSDSGEVLIDGSHPTASRRIGYVFQQHRLLPWRSVADNLRIVLDAAGLGKNDLEKRVEAYLQLVRMGHQKREFPGFLSEGERFRVSVARALCIDPEVILMDEPFSHLDELTARALRSELLLIWKQHKKSIIFVTHNPAEAVYLGDTVLVLSGQPARIVATVKVQEERPRSYASPRQLQLQKRLLDDLQRGASPELDFKTHEE